MKKIIILIIIFAGSCSIAQQYWQSMPRMTRAYLNRVNFVDTLYGWMSGDSGVILHTTNGGTNWVRQNSGIFNYAIDDLFFLDRNLGWGVANDFYFFGTKILKTTNGGLNWQLSVFPDTSLVFWTVYFLNPTTGFMSGYTGEIYKTTNGGSNWFPTRVDTSFCQVLYLFPKRNFSFLNSLTGFVCGGQIDIQGIIWKTTDGGLNWITNCVTPEPLYKIRADYPHKIIATGGDPEYGGSIAFSSDSGKPFTWIWDMLGPTNDSSYYGTGRALAYRNAAEVWVPLSLDTFWGVSLDSGDPESPWQKIPTPDRTYIFDALFVTPTFGWACGDTGAMLKYNSSIIGLSEKYTSLPLSFRLHQNYPNPFNPSTQLIFELSEPRFVKLKVYDILGRELETIANEFLPSGVYRYEWNASNYPSGVYFYKIEAGNWSGSGKMVLIR